MRIDFEEQIVINPVLGGVALWNFVSQYEKHAEPEAYPVILTLLPVLPIVFHKASVTSLKGMQFDSGLTKAIVDNPSIRVGLQRRIVSLSPLTLTSINIACASGLLQRVAAPGVPAFSRGLKRLPREVEPEGTARDIATAARRLGAFFARESIIQMQMKLGIML